LADEDDDGDPRRETDDHLVGDELDDGAQSSKAESHQNHACHQRRDLQARDAMLSRDNREHSDKCAGGSRYLHPRAAEDGSQQRRDDSGVESLFRTRAGRDGESHRQGQGNDAHHHAGEHVIADLSSRPQAFGSRLQQGDHVKRSGLRGGVVVRLTHTPDLGSAIKNGASFWARAAGISRRRGSWLACRGEILLNHFELYP
jgi:hypothetical protein